MADPNAGPITVTNNESGDRRHLVQPYKDRPVVELKPGSVGCPFCGNGNFRRSRLRFTDLLELLLLRYPVRCTRCSQRQYVEVSIALLSYPPKNIGPKPAKGQDTWQNWTSADAPVQTARPMSTAMGPRASRLEQSTAARTTPPAGTSTPEQASSTRDDDYVTW